MLKHLRQHVLLVACLGLGLPPLVGMLLFIDRLAERHLTHEVERSALFMARHVATSVPDVDLVFLGDLPSQAAQDQLISLRGMAGLFHYRLFDATGKLVLVSDAIGTPMPAGAPPIRLSPTVLAGRAEVVFRRGDGKSEPSVVSQAVVPVMHGNALIGVMEIQVDQAAPAAAAAQSFGLAAAASGLALGSMMTMGLWFWRRRTAQQEAAEQRMHYLTRHDLLTGAFNRSGFHEALAEACEPARHAARGLAPARAGRRY